MFKNRFFLTGLGIGIIIGALLLQMMIIGESSQQKLSNRDSAGAEQEEKIYSQSEVDAILEAQRATSSIKEESEATVSPSPAVTPEQTPSQSSAPQASATASPKPTAAPADNSSATADTGGNTIRKMVRIQAGTNLTAASELLAKEQLISDKAAFIRKMKQEKKLVRAGYFLFSGNPSLTEVITTITTQPMTPEEVKAFNSQ
ncbi:hypothetical protein SAMN04487969_101441 [Paenibacillus algorifonticola]|uniref:YceG-like family protein n=1 Tax=Paenibacillus algorifonticola TaxID=684063 RepID=A0A1I1YC51_9BACL|nr:hypothetical protein [Paenibacillus algorifonticola]SFE16999.1 hypothetical protein SAMN04487969_101441 [Paenibacillus algorifonticola]